MISVMLLPFFSYRITFMYILSGIAKFGLFLDASISSTIRDMNVPFDIHNANVNDRVISEIEHPTPTR